MRVIENQFYRVTIDPESGSVASIFDKQLQRELVDNRSPYKFGQYLYVTGGDGQTRIVWSHEDLPLAKLDVHPATNGQYLGTQRTSWGYSIKLRSVDVNTPEIDLEVLLFDSQKKIEFRYTVDKQFTAAKEAVYFAFPIQASVPTFTYTNQQSWIDPAKDLLAGASLEWFTVQRWMAVNDEAAAVAIVPIDAPLANFGDINRGEWPAEFHPATSTIFSYVMNNYWHTNYPAGQSGNLMFRYVITSAEHFDPSSLARLSKESMEPVVEDQVIHQDKIGNPQEPLPAAGTSFLELSNAKIELITWKQAEDGRGTILRLQEMAGESAETAVRLPHSVIRSAGLCNAVEDNLKSLPVAHNQIHLTFHPHEVLTIRMNVSSSR